MSDEGEHDNYFYGVYCGISPHVCRSDGIRVIVHSGLCHYPYVGANSPCVRCIIPGCVDNTLSFKRHVDFDSCCAMPLAVRRLH